MQRILVIIITALSLFVIIGIGKYNKMREQYEVAEGNVKAYSDLLGETTSQNTAYQLTIGQLKTFSDSVLVALNAAREELKIKDKKLKALQQIKSSFSRTDTITISSIDTIFKEPSFSVDTLIGDKWYSVKVGLRYPSAVIVKPEFVSEKYVIVSLKKETVKPRKKFFLARWLQKKHNVLKVDVLEKNPYVSNQSSRYVEILK